MGTLLPADPLSNPPSPTFPVRACLCLLHLGVFLLSIAMEQPTPKFSV